MKLHNISHFASVSELKPEIARVLIKNDIEKETIETVATDSYRLVTITYSYSEFPGLDLIPTGLYKPQDFKNLCSVFNKKKTTASERVKECAAFAKLKDETLSAGSYPGYNLLLDKNKSASSHGSISETYTTSYFIDFVKMVNELSYRQGVDMNRRSREGQFYASDCREFTHGVLEFKTNNACVLLMKVNK